MELRDWQLDAYNFFKNNPVSLFEVTTGAGKTFLSIYFIKKLLEKNKYLKVLIVGPKNVILEKTWLPELNTFGFPIHKVGLYNEFSKEFSQITLISIQSLKILTNQSEVYDMFDFVIFDEVHNYSTIGYRKILEIPKKYKIGLSATIEREDMNHVPLYGCFNYNIFKYKIDKALKDNVLNPFDFINVRVSIDKETFNDYTDISDKIKMLMVIKGSRNLKKEEDLYFKSLLNKRKQLIYNYEPKLEIVKDIINKHKDSKILVFNQYNKTSRNLFWFLMSEGIKSEVINSDISRYNQGNVFNNFENGKNNILLATTMLDEGYNLPKIDIAIIMASNSTSKQFYQRMGRVLRKKDINSKVYYLNVEQTFEEDNLNKKLELIKQISNSYKEVLI